MSEGAVAAGHPLTAEAGARMLREGGNAVDAAVAAVAASFATESPLTGLGAGGFMLVHEGGENVLLDFFVETPGRGGVERGEELLPVSVIFDETPQIFNVGAASCGVPGTPAGLVEAARRFGSMPLSALLAPAVELAREGVRVNAQQAYIHSLLEPITDAFEETRHLYSPGGRILGEGDVFRFAELADALELLGAEGSEPFYRGDVAERLSDWVLERGGTVSREDLASYEVVDRAPVRARFAGREVLSNPPPSSGGILIALCLELLERLGEAGVEELVAVMAEAQAARTVEFHSGLYEPGFDGRFLAAERLDEAAAAAKARRRPGGAAGPGDALGSTTHITAVDAEGRCAAVTCSNGTGSGMLPPGTGVHVNSMLGEHDLNPLGFHLLPAGRRVTSMMAPTLVLNGGELEAALGSGGSNRIRSAILQTVVHLLADRMPVQPAVDAGRVHFEQDVVQAEPGVDAGALERLERAGYRVARWGRLNLYFGGVHAIARDPIGGGLAGAGDPRRGGAVALA